MSAQPNYFRLGLFVVLGVALILGGLLVFGGGQMFRPKAYAETYVNGSVQGVDIGSGVKFRGVQIGRVVEIDFAFNRYDKDNLDQAKNYVVLVMEIDREVAPGIFDPSARAALEQNIKEGLRVRIEPQGITGLNYLDFGYVDPERFPVLQVSWVPDNFYMPYAPGEITNVLDSINNIMREVEKFNLQGFSENAVSLLENLNKSVVEAHIGEISNQLKALLSEFTSAIDAANVPAVSADAQKLLLGLDQSNTKLEELLVGLARSNASLEKILKNIEPSTRLNSSEVQAIVTNSAEITENLLQLSQEVKKRPSLLLWGKPKTDGSRETERGPHEQVTPRERSIPTGNPARR
ncbi:MAG: MlaD family protein [Terrimicrobiaceae bacterium]